jgi:2-keto-4-pentenoate hydratase/2-oxohepta-3-ene-1,7-dioic acid hydratase in catechol pathway
MKYATFSLPHDPAPRLGIVRDDVMIDVASAVGTRWPGEPPATLLALVEAGPAAWQHLRGAIEAPGSGDGYPLSSVRWHAPIPRPRKNVLCLGRNYAEHVKEGARAAGREAEIPKAPVFFTKAPTAVNGPFDDVPWHHTVTSMLDYEAELGVVIGIGGINIERSRAHAHVFGYTVMNDITGRDVQRLHMQWFKGKSLDGSCPIGPCVVTADEFGDPQAKRITLRVNGVTRQDGSTADMIFPVDTTIEWLSRGMTLEPGDLIATGTPDGVGMGRTPPEYLAEGDVVETEIEGIGTMRNRIVRV